MLNELKLNYTIYNKLLNMLNKLVKLNELIDNLIINKITNIIVSNDKVEKMVETKNNEIKQDSNININNIKIIKNIDYSDGLNFTAKLTNQGIFKVHSILMDKLQFYYTIDKKKIKTNNNYKLVINDNKIKLINRIKKIKNYKIYYVVDIIIIDRLTLSTSRKIKKFSKNIFKTFFKKLKKNT